MDRQLDNQSRYSRIMRRFATAQQGARRASLLSREVCLRNLNGNRLARAGEYRSAHRCALRFVRIASRRSIAAVTTATVTPLAIARAGDSDNANRVAEAPMNSQNGARRRNAPAKSTSTRVRPLGSIVPALVAWIAIAEASRRWRREYARNGVVANS
jgi:hypothetical protein